MAAHPRKIWDELLSGAATPHRFPEYRGMSYEQASREAKRLVDQNWFQNLDRLVVLREIMRAHKEAA